jgi:hypothetical protein
MVYCQYNRRHIWDKRHLTALPRCICFLRLRFRAPPDAYPMRSDGFTNNFSSRGLHESKETKYVSSVPGNLAFVRLARRKIVLGISVLGAHQTHNARRRPRCGGTSYADIGIACYKLLLHQGAHCWRCVRPFTAAERFLMCCTWEGQGISARTDWMMTMVPAIHGHGNYNHTYHPSFPVLVQTSSLR